MNSNWNPADASTWCRLGGELPQNKGEIIVVVDESSAALSDFFVAESSSLPENLAAGLLSIPSSPDDGALLNALKNTLVALFPDAKEKLDIQAPQKWIQTVQRQRQNSDLQGCWLLVDGFHHTLNSPREERQLFTQLLQKFAKLPASGVMAGITVEFATEIAILLKLIEEVPLRPVEMPNPEPRPEKSQGAGRVWLIRCAAACIGLGVGVSIVYYLSKKSKANEPEQVTESVAFTVRSPEAAKPGEVKKEVVEPATNAEVKKNNPEPLAPVVIQAIEPAGHTPEEPKIETKPVETKTAEAEVELLKEKWEGKTKDEQDLQYYVAEAYCFGHGVEADLEKGIELLKTASENGSGKAANLLGTCYSRGHGVEENYGRAHELLNLAVKRGVFQAHGNLGVLYLQGLGCEKDPKKAREHFVAGAKSGDPVAAFFAAKCFEDGIGNLHGARDPDTAVRWYLEAAKNGHDEAIAWCRAHKLNPLAETGEIIF